jgi:thymidylate synthase
MISFTGDCFNAYYLRALKIALSNTSYENSRVGPVINLGQAFFEIPPNDPRIIFLNHRKLNPVFAIIEGSWILSGSNKLEPLLDELPIFSEYSDDGETLNGAYGYRLRSFFGFDQINTAIKLLKNDSNTRRVVMTMYSPSDLKSSSLDIPCNISVCIKINSGSVDITVLNRSNDLYLGLPYNIFIFGLIQKYFSIKLGLRIGVQRHFTDSLHLYEKNIDQAKIIIDTNNPDSVSIVSNKFDFEYSASILKNCLEILSKNYDAINDQQLSVFLKSYNRESRQHNNSFESRHFLSGFYGLLACQCFPYLGCGRNDNMFFESLRRLMMPSEIKQLFEQLSTSSGHDIAQNIMRLTENIKGKFSVFREILDKQSGPFGYKNYDDEEQAFRVLLLCLVWTTLDPFTANTPIGAIQKKEIENAALLLDVPTSELGPLCLVENELFSALSDILPI